MENTAWEYSESPLPKVHLTAEGALAQTPELNAYISIMRIAITSEFFPGTGVL